ncbi:MAG TPA: hypothetical protein VKG80_02180 [Trebonia sp.]|nr:hypothetical protein [Trebonia sp.]
MLTIDTLGEEAAERTADRVIHEGYRQAVATGGRVIVQRQEGTLSIQRSDGTATKGQPTGEQANEGKVELKVTAPPLRPIMEELLKSVDPKTRETLTRHKTIAIGAVVELGSRTPRLVYTTSNNWKNPDLEAAAEKLGLTRWSEQPRAQKGERGPKGAPGDAEQLMLGEALENSYRVIEMATSREVCGDCKEALKDYEYGPIPVDEVLPPTAAEKTGTPETAAGEQESRGGEAVEEPPEAAAEEQGPRTEEEAKPEEVAAEAANAGVIIVGAIGSVLSELAEEKERDKARAELARLEVELDEHRRKYPGEGGLVTIYFSRIIYTLDSPFQPPKVFRWAEPSYGRTQGEARRQKPPSLTVHRPDEEWTTIEIWIPPLHPKATRPGARVITVEPLR